MNPELATARRPKNILVILTSREPGHDGDYLRFRHIFPLLARTNRLTLLYLDSHDRVDYTSAFSRWFHQVEVFRYRPGNPFHARLLDLVTLRPHHSIRRRDPELHSQVSRLIAEIIEREQIELVICWVRAAEQFLQYTTIPVLFDLCDALPLQLGDSRGLYRSPKQWFHDQRVKRLEANIVARYPVTFVSNRDASWFRHRFDTTVIPNGVEIEWPETLDIEPEANSILFSGSMNFRPNVDAALYFANNILPLLIAKQRGLKWYVVGANPGPELLALQGHPNIVVTGPVESMAEYICRAQVVVTPVVSGSGIKNKVLEAMALVRPVVSTSLGIEGIACTPGEDVIVADDPQAFADAVLRLLSDRDARLRISTSGRQLMEREYSWQHTAARYDRLFDRLIREHAEKIGTRQ